MPLDLDLAHRRYVQQANWTESMRRHLLTSAGLPNAHRVLEVGCGTGAVLQTIPQSPRSHIFGLDVDHKSLKFASQYAPSSFLTCDDAHKLPYSDATFDIVFTHFVLLWLKRPSAALEEMRRVTRRGGAVLTMAEPDYSRRVDEPASLAELGNLQTKALRQQGARPETGAGLAELFQAAGLAQIETGEIHATNLQTNKEDFELELAVLRADLASSVPAEKLDVLLADASRAWQRGEYRLHVPTYYALGRVP